MERVGEVYDAVLAQGQLLKAGDMQRFNLSKYLRRRATLPGESQPKELARSSANARRAARSLPPPRPPCSSSTCPPPRETRRERLAQGMKSVSETEAAAWDDARSVCHKQLPGQGARGKQRGSRGMHDRSVRMMIERTLRSTERGIPCKPENRF